MSEFSTLVANVGFPIAIASASGYALYKVFTMLFVNFINALDKVVGTNEELVKTNTLLASKLDIKLDKVLEALEKEDK